MIWLLCFCVGWFVCSFACSLIVWMFNSMPPTGNARDARLKAFGQAAAVPKAEPVKEVPAAAAASTAMEGNAYICLF